MSQTTIKLRDQKPGETCYFDTLNPEFVTRKYIMDQIIAALPPDFRDTICLLELTLSIRVYRAVTPEQLEPSVAESNEGASK